MRPRIDKTGTRVLFEHGGAAHAAPWADGQIVAGEYLTAGLAAALSANGMSAPDAYSAPFGDAAASPPRVVAAALGVNVQDSDIASISGPFNIVGGLYEGVGTYTFIYNAAVPEQHFLTCSDPRLSPIAQETEFCTVEARDGGGTLVDIDRFAVVISIIE